MNEHSVYLIANESLTHVKIGRVDKAGAATARLKQLQTGHHERLHILCVLKPDQHPGETQLHEQFKEYRTVGEWFRLDGAIVEFALPHMRQPDARLLRREATLRDRDDDLPFRHALIINTIHAMYRHDPDGVIAAIGRLILNTGTGLMPGFSWNSIAEIDRVTHHIFSKSWKNTRYFVDDATDLEIASDLQWWRTRRNDI